MSADQVPRTGRHPSLDNKHQLSEKVASYVREAIMIGELRASEYIRTERLAADLGISATPVREALMTLHSEGAVRWEPRRGFRVLPLTAQDVSDLFEVQAHIAGELAARAVDSLSDTEIERLQGVQDELEVAARARNVELVDRLNHEIHRTINKCSGSTKMTTLLNLMVHYVPLGFFGAIDGWAEASAHDHSAIFNALRSRDRDDARLAMSEHILHIGRLLVENLQSRSVLSEPSENAAGSLSKPGLRSAHR